MRCLREINVDNNTVGWYSFLLAFTRHTNSLARDDYYKWFPCMCSAEFPSSGLFVISWGPLCCGWPLPFLYVSCLRLPRLVFVVLALGKDKDRVFWLCQFRFLRLELVFRYQSTMMGAFQTMELIETFINYQESIKRCICIIYDPQRTKTGGLKVCRGRIPFE